jgi:ribonuclease R
LEASISGVTSFGIFVVADQPFVEGLVRTHYLLPDDFYELDSTACRLSGRRTGHTFSLGDRVKVEIVQVSVARRRIEMRLHDADARPPANPRSTRLRRQVKRDRGQRRRELRRKNSGRKKK